MKKENFKKVALMGLAAGLLASGQGFAHTEGTVTVPGQQVAASCASCGANRPQSSGRGRSSIADTYDQNSSWSSQPSSSNTSWSSSPSTTTWSNSNSQISESALLQQISPQSRALYQSFDRDTKNSVLRTANQFTDKNEAVRAAAQQQQMQGQPRSNSYYYNNY